MIWMTLSELKETAPNAIPTYGGREFISEDGRRFKGYVFQDVLELYGEQNCIAVPIES